MISALIDIFDHRTLVLSMVRRSFKMRFLASVLGWLWIVATPIMLLCVYSFVFGYIFKPNWPILAEKNVSYVLFLFTGLTVYWIFAEIINNAPGAIRSQQSLVKKVKFPIHILSVVLNVNALISWSVNFILLLCAMLVFGQAFHWTALLVPLTLLPILFLTLGLGWLLAATGTYFRDVGQAAGVINLTGLFLSAIFFPVTALPEKAQSILVFNPVAVSIEALRACLLYGDYPDWNCLLYTSPSPRDRG